MGAHESMEHAEHAEHASGSNKKIALLIAVIALFLALSETLGKGAQTEAISKNVEASNLWAFFQAKSIRRTVVQATAEHAKLSMGTVGDDAAKAALQKQIDDWKKTAARYRSEPETGEGSEATRQARQACRARARRGDGKVSPLRNRLGRLPDRHRAGVRHHHHRHDRAGLGVGRIGGRGHRHYRAWPLRAASVASALSCSPEAYPVRVAVRTYPDAREVSSACKAGLDDSEKLPRLVHALAKTLDQPQRAR